MSKYQVIGNVKRAGKLLPRNKPAEFEDNEETAALVRDGFLAAVPAKAAAAGEADPKAANGNGDKDGKGKSGK